MGTRPDRERSVLGATAGVAAALVALGVAEIGAALLRPQASPVVAVGGVVVDAAPVWLKEYAVRTFGTADKPILIGGVLVVLALLAAGTGVLAGWRLRAGLAGVAALGLVAGLAVLARPGARPLDLVPSVVGAAVGSLALARILRPLDPASPMPVVDTRRRVLVVGLLVAGGGIAAGSVGRLVTGRRTSVGAARAAVRLPAPTSPAPPLPRGADLRIAGLSPFRTPNLDFYRIDTALVVPQVSTEGWRLRVHGMVDREVRLTFDDLLARDLVERDITLTCVSNEVGGQYVGNARWLGALLAPVLAEAGVDPRADLLLSTSADGMTIGTPTAAVTDGREALLAVGMNGVPLPVSHGFPVRMVVPGLYGYVSATKWLVDLELTRFDSAEAYWTQRGWAARGPVRTMSRIDTPRSGARLAAGRVAVAGVAWAQHRGIERVEVRVDRGNWQPARLAPIPSADTWRQWVWPWAATPGSHLLEVRATDGAGAIQPGRRVPPFPAGATGWHGVQVDVS